MVRSILHGVWRGQPDLCSRRPRVAGLTIPRSPSGSNRYVPIPTYLPIPTGTGSVGTYLRYQVPYLPYLPTRYLPTVGRYLPGTGTVLVPTGTVPYLPTGRYRYLGRYLIPGTVPTGKGKKGAVTTIFDSAWKPTSH